MILLMITRNEKKMMTKIRLEFRASGPRINWKKECSREAKIYYALARFARDGVWR